MANAATKTAPTARKSLSGDTPHQQPGATGYSLLSAITRDKSRSRILVVGGGAGGLELAVKLARKFRRKRDTEVSLIDKNPTHIWKPLLHEVATGSMNSSHDEASYQMLARKHRFRFVLGCVIEMDLDRRRVVLAPVDDDAGREIMPERTVEYDQLAVAVGSFSNDFGISGVRAPSWLADSGLPTDKLGRIEVNRDLTVKGRDDVFAIGDCCACFAYDGKEIPPRAQAAHQMASIAAKNLRLQRAGKPLKNFTYRDFGSLVSLSKFSTIGNLMGNLMGNLVRGTVFIEGWIAHMVYLSLYRMHQAAVHGRFSMLLIVLGDRIYRATRAEVKLH